MALTDTKKAKEFMAGAPDIKLKGDLRPIKMASAPDPMDERNNALENLADQYYGKPLRDLSPKEIELLEEALEEMTMKSAPSMKMASMDENEREFMRLVEEFMERGFSQQEAIDAAREEFDKKAMAYGGRAQYGLGSLVKSVKKAVKGVVKGVGKVAKSPLGLAAIGLGINQFGIPGIGLGKGFLNNLFTKGGTL